MKHNFIIHKNVKLGENATIEDFVILGKPPRGAKSGELELKIGTAPLIRTGTIIYAGNTIGENFQTGDYARIREGNTIGHNVSIGGGTVVEGGCTMGNNVRIHSNCFIPEYTRIESNAWIGPGVIMTNVLHPPCPAFKEKAPLWGQKCCCGPVIQKSAVIGAGVVVLPGVVIGEGALVGAGAVVSKNVHASVVVAGFPARLVKKTAELDCPIGLYNKGEVYSWRKK